MNMLQCNIDLAVTCTNIICGIAVEKKQGALDDHLVEIGSAACAHTHENG